MSQEKDPRKVQEELARKNANQSAKKLTFDPTTGELIVKSSADPQQPNEVVVDQIYKDGFFR
jgi:hypothetical protein